MKFPHSILILALVVLSFTHPAWAEFGHAVQNFANGKPHGYKCFQIVPGGPWAKHGLVDRDIILSIDGVDPVSTADPKALLGKLDLKQPLKIQVERDGKPTSLESKP
jgi:S1-C subfamily serine protease